MHSRGHVIAPAEIQTRLADCFRRAFTPAAESALVPCDVAAADAEHVDDSWKQDSMVAELIQRMQQGEFPTTREFVGCA